MKKFTPFLVAAVLLIMVISYLVSGSRVNPPVEAQVTWDSPATQDMFMRACADCHSHETKWPWYTNFAPISWRVIDHVNEGREEFNISVAEHGEADEAAEKLLDGSMPLWDYLLFHPEAKLTDSEKQQFAQGLTATFGGKENDSGKDE